MLVKAKCGPEKSTDVSHRQNNPQQASNLSDFNQEEECDCDETGDAHVFMPMGLNFIYLLILNLGNTLRLIKIKTK